MKKQDYRLGYMDYLSGLWLQRSAPKGQSYAPDLLDEITEKIEARKEYQIDTAITACFATPVLQQNSTVLEKKCAVIKDALDFKLSISSQISLYKSAVEFKQKTASDYSDFDDDIKTYLQNLFDLLCPLIEESNELRDVLRENKLDLTWMDQSIYHDKEKNIRFPYLSSKNKIDIIKELA